VAGTDPTPIERRFLGMIDGLKQVGAIKVGGEEQGCISQIVEDSVAVSRGSRNGARSPWTPGSSTTTSVSRVWASAGGATTPAASSPCTS